ncbi:hypothetical protein D8O31_19740 [Burkholderia mallei]|nr:hypothetical protein D8O31_19740 [Burkholderia mallei]
MASAVAEDKSGQRERSTLTDKRHAARDAAGGMPNACDARGAAHEKKVHRGIPGNAARILRKKYCSSRYP